MSDFVIENGILKEYKINPVAVIKNGYKEKFGVPRQSGLAPSVESEIVFLEDFRDENMIRDIEKFSHLWLIWEFSANRRSAGEWQPTVRPPRLGGNTHIGVFATRSPFRPNPLGLSCVKVSSVDLDPQDGPVIYVTGADLMDGTPIYDIKPYIRYADARPEAVCGYVDDLKERTLKVVLPGNLAQKIEDRDVIPALIETLRLDPRPSYHDDPHREYGMAFAGYNIRFTVMDGVLEVTDVNNLT